MNSDSSQEEDKVIWIPDHHDPEWIKKYSEVIEKIKSDSRVPISTRAAVEEESKETNQVVRDIPSSSSSPNKRFIRDDLSESSVASEDREFAQKLDSFSQRIDSLIMANQGQAETVAVAQVTRMVGDLKRPTLKDFSRRNVNMFLEEHQAHIASCVSARLSTDDLEREKMFVEFLSLPQKRIISKRLNTKIGDLTQDEIQKFLNEATASEDELDPVALLKGKTFIRYSNDCRHAILQLEMYISDQLNKKNVPEAKIAEGKQGLINFFTILSYTLPETLRSSFKQQLLDKKHPIEKKDNLYKNPSYKECMEIYSGCVTDWFRSLKLCLSGNKAPKEGTLMKVSSEKEVVSGKTPKVAKLGFSKKQQRLLLKALKSTEAGDGQKDKKPKTPRPLRCFRCGQEHHLRDCSLFDDALERQKWYDEFIKSKKAKKK